MWDTANNWDPNTVPGASDSIILTSSSTPGPQTIDLGGSLRSIDEIYKDGVNGDYIFTNGTLRLFSSNNGLLQAPGNGALQVDADIELNTQNDDVLFNVVSGSDQIVVNGDIESSAASGTTTLLLTSRDLLLDPSVLVNGVISNGGSGSTVAVTAGFAPDSENHRGVVKLTGLNTYTGPTTVHGAVLDFNSVSNVGGGASALGAPTDPGEATIRLGAIDTSSNAEIPGTLRYTGTGHSTDRTIELAPGGGGIIEANGAGPLVFTAPTFVMSAGSKTLTLSGSSTAANTIESNILDTPGIGQDLTVEKTGIGAWVLTGANSYGGGTVLSQGTVSVGADNNLGAASSAINFNGGTLQVTGTSFASTARTINWLAGGAFDIADPNHTFAVSLGSAGAGDLTKLGVGTLQLDGVNEFAGDAIINGGDLRVASGSTLVNTDGYIDSASTVTVDGPGSTWTNSSNLFVGDRGDGTLDITGGGLVTNSTGQIGQFGGTTGAVTVAGVDPNGTPSTWDNSSRLYVGFLGDGTLDITGGGVVTNSTGQIGQFGGTTGAVTVAGVDPNGTPSTWDNSSQLYVGFSGDGTLDITGGGVVTNTLGLIGEDPNSTGAVTVAGVDPNGTPSTWTNSSNLFVGDRGDGTLDITGGGLVTNFTGQIGRFSGSTGAVTVAGVDPNGTPSTWDNSSRLIVGETGDGALDITGGGLVTNGLGNIGLRSGSTGAVTVSGFDPNSGTPSTWTNSGLLRVGSLGNGTLDITGGGLVTNTEGFIGSGLASTHAVKVEGTNPNNGTPSTWTNFGALYVGEFGNGTLDITGGGLVTNTDGFIGFGFTSTGAVTVEGSGSTWDTSNNLYVGGNQFFAEGDGTLTISGGGLVTNTDGFIGFEFTSTGAVTVEGSGSTWENSNNLFVGGNNLSAGGAGTLTVSGGEVSVGGELKIWNTGTVNLEGGTLDAATLDLTDVGSTFSMTGGRLEVGTVEGDLNIAGGTLAPGESAGLTTIESAGLTTITGDFNPQAAATLEIEIGGTTAETQYDVLQIDGAAVLAGALDVSLLLLEPFAPALGDTFEIIDVAGSLSGTFAGLPNGASVGKFGGVDLLIDYAGGDGNDVVLTAGLAGDFDFDGDVDVADALEGQRLGASLSDWAANFGTGGAPLSGVGAVPEPAALVLVLTGVCPWGVRRRQSTP